MGNNVPHYIFLENQRRLQKEQTQEHTFYSLAKDFIPRDHNPCGTSLPGRTRPDRDDVRSRTFLLLTLALLVFADHSHGEAHILYCQTPSQLSPQSN